MEIGARLRRMREVAIPLRGYVVCNVYRVAGFVNANLVAIPLRGYVVCNPVMGR
jgi:hypothetical protein